MLRNLRGDSITYLAYIGFLNGFIGLGLFVYALAAGSTMAGIIGAVLVISHIITVWLFRVGARKRAADNDSGIEIPGVNVLARPLKRGQIDQYLATYRGAPHHTDDHQNENRLVSVGAGSSSRRDDERLAA